MVPCSALIACPSAAAVAGSCRALTQQPVSVLHVVGGWPLGRYSYRSYWVPSKSGNSRRAIVKKGNRCPLGFYDSGIHCVSSPGNEREAIQNVGKSSSLGWFSSGSYCINSR
jgi:hypothetical protein